MSFDLSSIGPVGKHAPRTVIYGVPGVGKTTLAAQAKDAVFLPVESGVGLLDVQAFPQPETFDDVLEAISTLILDDHGFKTLVIDGLDQMERLVWDFTCRNIPHEKGHHVKRIEDYGFGKGYTHALGPWSKFVRGLDVLALQQNIGVILLAHSTVYKFRDPDGEAYELYQLRLHSNEKQSAEGIVTGWCDNLLFLNYEKATVTTSDDRKRAVGKGQRVVYTQQRPAFKAKNRYKMPAQIKIPDEDPAACWAKLSSYFPEVTPTKETPAPQPKASREEPVT